MNRSAIATMTRRASFLLAGVAGTATLAGQFVVAKKNSSKKLKKAKKACQRDLAACTEADAICAAQVEECATFVTAICGGVPACLQLGLCCPSLENCDATAFMNCVVATD